uniref:Uncharacterized protein n=1 Tax=Kalanchoe fedtschenkoi TaxID=63787 RepID=A0A7N0TQ88_KALFE
MKSMRIDFPSHFPLSNFPYTRHEHVRYRMVIFWQGHGACSFRQWLDVPLSTASRVRIENNQFKIPQSPRKQADHPLVVEDECGGKRLKITELEEGSSLTDGDHLSSNSEVSLACLDTNDGLVMSPMELEDLPAEFLREIMECEYPFPENDKMGCNRLKITELEGSQEIVSPELSPSSKSTISSAASNGNEISMLNATDFDPFDTDEDFINEVIAFESTLIYADEPQEVSYHSQEKAYEAPPAKYQDVDHRQFNFCKLMLSAATALPEANCISLMLGAQYLGWLSRLAFGSPRGLVVPLPKPLFCCILPNFDPIFAPRGLSQITDKYQIVSAVDKSLALPQVTAPQESLGGDFPNITLKEPPTLRRPPFVAEANNVMDAAIMEAFGQAAMLIQSKLFTRLESMDPTSHESMVKEANTVFGSLDRLKVDYGQFYQCVKDFIDAASSFNQVKTSIHNSVLYQDYHDRCNQEKLRLEQLSAEHASVMTSLARSQEHLKSLQNEAEEARNRLLQIEQKISDCEMEAKNLNIHLIELSEQMNKCEDSVLCASLEAEAAHKLYLQREAELNAAQDVFEKAKIQLRNKAG